jgi:Na+-transporting NADH:ubiquinone oxidoreductase subunit C
VAKETIGKTFFVAFALCVVCSVMVSAAAVILKPTQTANKLADKKKNILSAAGLYVPGADIEAMFEQIETRLVNLETGKYTDEMDAGTFDFVRAAKGDDLGTAIDAADDRAGIKRRSRYIPVYLVRKQGAVDKIVLPLYGKGLWSTLYGFLALDRDDLSTIRSLVFYEHGETPGLGGEVDNPNWKALWNGKQAYDQDGNISIQIVRGAVDPTSPTIASQVDGLSGATITSRGVHDMLHYWLGSDGYGPFLKQLRNEGGMS